MAIKGYKFDDLGVGQFHIKTEITVVDEKEKKEKNSRLPMYYTARSTRPNTNLCDQITLLSLPWLHAHYAARR